MRPGGHIRSWCTLSLVAAVLSPVGLVSPEVAARADASCTQWDVTGTWRVDNGPYSAIVELEQTDQSLVGTATLPGIQQDEADWVRPTNPLVGKVEGDQLTFTVTARHKSGFLSKGFYVGTITDGGASGDAKDLNAPTRGSVKWRGVGPTKCVRTGSSAPLSDDQAEAEFESTLTRGMDLDTLLNVLSSAWCPKEANCTEANAVADDVYREFLKVVVPSGGAPTAQQLDAADLAASAALLATIADKSGNAYPSIGGLMPVILKMALNIATATDAATALDITTATGRLIAIAVGNDSPDTLASSSPTP